MNGSWSAAGGIIVKSDAPADVGITFIQVTRDNGEGWDDQDASQALFYRDPATPIGTLVSPYTRAITKSRIATKIHVEMSVDRELT